MRITNEKLLADAAEIVASSGYYMNEVTGEIRQGQAFSYLMSTLRDYKYRWRNVSDIRERDFEDSGFDVIHQGNYYNGPKSSWVAIHPDYNTGKISKGRRVSKSAWIICSKTPVDAEVLEAGWVAETEARVARSKVYGAAYEAAKLELADSGMTPIQIMNEASKRAQEAVAA